MKFTTLFSLVASATLAIAQTGNPTDHFNAVDSPAEDQSIKAGSTFNIVWEPTKEFDDETISIKLLGGKTPGTLQPMGDIATGVKSSEGTFAWKVKSSLGKDATYGISLVLESNPKTFQFSHPFHIKKAAGGSDDETDSTTSGTATNSDSETKTSSEEETSSTSMTMTTSTKAPKTTKTTESTSSEAESTTMTPSATESSASATESQTETSSSASAKPSSGAAAIGANGVLALGGVAAAILAL